MANENAQTKTPAPQVVEPTPSPEPKAKVTEVPDNMRHNDGDRKDETIPGGMTVQRINNGKHFQVQDAEGRPIPGKVYDPIKKEIVSG